MGFKSVMKKIGKVALKVAPYAAMAIPGVGVPLGMAISGAANAASKKVSGGSWKDALISGGIGAGTAAIGGGALKGIGPSSSVVKKLGAGALGKATGTGVTGKIGGMLGSMGASALGRPSLVDPNAASGNRSWGDVASNSIDALGRMNNQRMQGNGQQQAYSRGNESNDGYGIGPSSNTMNQAVSRNAGEVMPRGGYGYRDNPMNQLDQNKPNLAQSIFQGRQESIKNQPFRKGYDVTTNIGEPDEEGKYQTSVSRMPKIYDTGGSDRNRRSRQAAR